MQYKKLSPEYTEIIKEFESFLLDAEKMTIADLEYISDEYKVSGFNARNRFYSQFPDFLRKNKDIIMGIINQ